MKKEWKNLLILFGLTAFLCACCFLPNIILGKPLAYGTDIKSQQYLFSKEYFYLFDSFFKNGSLPFYSWHSFLGTNFFAAYSFYGNADIFNLLAYFIRNINFFDRTMIIEVLKLFIASFSMYWLLSIFGYKDKVKIIGSLCFAFSSWSLFYSGQLFFLSFYCLTPFYLIGIEKYLRDKKCVIFFLSVIMLAFTNWYFFYSLSLLTPVYFIYRYYLLKDNFKHFIKDTLIIIGIYVLAVGVAAFYLLPTAEYIAGNNRIGSLVGIFYFSDIRIYINQLVSTFVPNYLYLYRNNILDSGWHVTREICLWATGLVGLLVSQVIFIKDKTYDKFKRATIILYVILIIIMLLPIGNSMMHGFSEPSFRWLFIFTFINILTACHLLNNLNVLHSKSLIICTVVISIILISCIPLTSILTNSSIGEYQNQLILFVISALIIIVYCFVLSSSIKQKLTVLLICVVIEIGAFSSTLFYTSISHDQRSTYAFNDKVIHVLQDNDNEFNTYLNNLEEGNYDQYYRVWADDSSIFWNYSQNMALAYQINGLETYSSTYEPSFNTMRDMFLQVSIDKSAMLYNILDSNIIQFLNTKYAIATDESQLPANINWELVVDDYRGTIQIYKNTDYKNIGTNYYQTLLVDDVDDSSQLLDYIICDKDTKAIIDNFDLNGTSTLTDTYYGNNEFHSSIETNGDSFMIITIPYNEGWKINIDGQQVDYYEVNGGFIGLNVKDGSAKLDMYFVPVGFKTGVIISAVSLVASIALLIFVKYKKKMITK